MIKRIVLIFALSLITVTVTAMMVIPSVVKNPASAAAAGPGYLFTLKSNDKDNFIVTTLADRRLVRLQLVLELNSSFQPKDIKNPDRKLLVMQDSLIRLIRTCRSDDLSAQNDQAFKMRVTDAATQVLGENSVRSVYLTGLTVD